MKEGRYKKKYGYPPGYYKRIDGQEFKCYGVGSKTALEKHKKKLESMGMKVHIRGGKIYAR